MKGNVMQWSASHKKSAFSAAIGRYLPACTVIVVIGLVILISRLGLIPRLAAGMPQALSYANLSPVLGQANLPGEAIQAAWRRAQQSGVYHYSTELIQTIYPSPALSNVGRSAQEDLLYMEGQTDLPNRAMQLTLWTKGGSAASRKDGIEVRIEGDEAYGRSLGGDWQKINDFSATFAPGQDLLAYLAGAKNVRAVGDDLAAPAFPGLAQYVFDLDGPAFGRYVTEQLERALQEKGELPAGLTLEVANEYLGMTGGGRVWLTSDGLPARLTIEAEFPQREDGQRVAVSIKTDFSAFAPLEQASAPNLWGGALGLLTWRDWQRASLQGAIMLFALALGLLVYSRRHSRLVYAGVTLTIIFSLVISPLLQSQQASAFYQRQSAESATAGQLQKDAQAEQDALEAAFTSNWDPHQPPGAAPLAADLSDHAADLGDLAQLRQELSIAPQVSQSAAASATIVCSDAERSADTDQDGLTDCQEKGLSTNPARADSDGDTLNDGQEVMSLGTDPKLKDTDGDGISDNAEVVGFSYQGQKWYTNPRSPDTNKDGTPDGLECPEMLYAADQLSPTNVVCRNTDASEGDVTPDAFDIDNDGDGVPDRIDLSPSKKVTGFRGGSPFLFAVQSLEANRDVLVDFQIRPANAAHLTYAMNVLDWPAGDVEGQVTRTRDTTFASSLTEAQANATPNTQNGDMRLLPMLEITLSGSVLPLPRTTPRAVRQLTSGVGGWISATVSLAPLGDSSAFTLTHDIAGGLDSVTLYDGGCFSATQATIDASPVVTATFSEVASGSQNVIGQKLLSVVDGNHALVLKEGDQTACVALGDLPNGKDADRMIDTDALGFYGISARDADANGTVVVYIPVNMVYDDVSDSRMAFSARMLYRQSGSDWGAAQAVRLVWLVQLYDDDDQIQTIHVYQDDFTLTGLMLREDHGLNVSVAFEDPAVDNATTVDNYLWQAADGLLAGFISGRQNASGQLDLTLSEFQRRFADPGDTGDARLKRWNIPAGKVKVLSYSFANQDGLAQFPVGENQQILNTYFTSSGAPLASMPTLLFAREEIYRDINLESADALVNQSTVTLDVRPANQPLQKLAAFNWAPFQYQDGNWRAYPLQSYWDAIGANYRALFQANPPDYLRRSDPAYETMLDAMVMLARANQLATMQGYLGVVTRGSEVLTNMAAVEPDFSLAENLTNNTAGVILNTVATLADDYVQKMANKALAVQEAAGKAPTEEAIKTIGEAIENYQDAGKSLPGGFIYQDWWTPVGKGLAVITAVMCIAAAWTGDRTITTIALSLSIVSALYSAVDAIARLVSITRMAGELFKISKMLNAASCQASAIGAVISSVMAVGLFFAQWAIAQFSPFSLAFNAALAGMIGAIIAAVVMLGIAMIPIVGQILAALIGLIDAVLALLCHLFVAEEEKENQKFLCGGIGGAINRFAVALIYSSVPLVGNMSDADRLEFLSFKPSLVDVTRGYAVGSDMNYQVTVRNTINLTDPNAPPDGQDPNWKSQLYASQFNEANLRMAAFAYKLQVQNDGFSAAYNSMASSWQKVAGASPLALQMAQVVSVQAPNDVAGINQPARIYLSEAYAIPTQECWLIPILGYLVPVCWVREDSNVIHNDLGETVKWDIFPATLDGFYTPSEHEDGYSLAWGQSPHVTVADTGRVLAFPRMKDFDGDSLLNKSDNGMDPNDSLWDTDNDGLSDPYELAHGSDPENIDSDSDGLNDYLETRLKTDLRRVDSDGDGLTDQEETLGWDIVYGFRGATPLITRAFPDPLQPDADGDGVLDKQEKILGTNPRAPSSSVALTYQTRLTDLNAASLLLRFEETVNATGFSDHSGMGRIVTCSDAACPVSGVAGYLGNALQFDGLDDAVRVSNPPALKNASFSVAFWAKRDTVNASQWIVAQGGSGLNNQSLRIGFAANNTFVCGFGNNDLATSAVYTDAGWRHYACTFDAANRSRSIYVDGSLAAQDTAGAVYQGAGDLLIGSGPDGAFQGRLDEVGVYASALPAAAIEAVRLARYTSSDLIVRPGDQVWYQGVVKNELNNRTAQGLLRTDAPSSLLSGAVPPATFVLDPADSAIMTGVFTVSQSAPAGNIPIIQVAGGQVVDWRNASDYADLWLKLDDVASSTVFADSSGVQPRREAVCYGAACPASGQSGVRGYAAQFDGVDDSLVVNNSAAFNPAYLTIAGWINAANFTSLGAPLVTKGGSKGEWAIWSLDFYGGALRMYLSQSQTLPMICMADSALSAQAWHHVAGVYDGTNISLYADGALIKTCSYAGGALSSNTRPIVMGARQSRYLNQDQRFAGLMDDVRIYPRALNRDEIGALVGAPALSLAFEGSSSNSSWLQDGSGGGSNGTCGGANGWTCPSKTSAGVTGSAAEFQGVSEGAQFIKIASSNDSLNLSSGHFTQAAWVYPAADAANYPQGILGYDSGEKTGTPTLQRVGNKLRVGFGSGSEWREFTTPTDVLTPNAWNHVAATFDGVTYRIYVNGIERASTDALSGLSPSNSATLWVGRSTDKGSVYIHYIHVTDPKDWFTDAEVCISWTDSLTTGAAGIWNYNGAKGGGDYAVDLWKTFTDFGRLTIWEDDGGVYCGAANDNWDDAVWSSDDDFFRSYNMPVLNETSYDLGYSWILESMTGKLYLGDAAATPPRPAVKINAISFRGRLDDVRVYRYTMSSDEVQALYQNGTMPLYLRFDDPSGAGLSRQGYNNAVDPTKGANGVCSPASACPTTGAPGRINLAAQFDGVNDYVEVRNTASLAPQKISIAAWIQADAWTPEYWRGVIAAKDSPSGQGFRLSAGENGRAAFGVSVDGQWYEAVSPQVMSLGVWYHVVGAYDGGTISVYINGALQASTTRQGSISSAATNLTIGRSAAWPDRLFKGAIDDLRVYSINSLAAVEVQAIYQAAPTFLMHLEETSTGGGFANAASTLAGSCSGAACPAVGLKGQLGLAPRFDGINDAIVVNNNNQLTPQRFSVAAWIKANTWASTVEEGAILAKDGAGHFIVDYVTGYSLSAGDNGRAAFAFSMTSQWCKAVSPQVMPPGTWNHVLGVYDGSAVRIYVNGVLQATTTCSGAPLHSNTALNIGRSPYWPNRAFNGFIDEAAIYPAALSVQEVRNLYNLQAGYVEDRVSSAVIVDIQPPSSALASSVSGGYRPEAAQVLGVTASDDRAGVALVELGACRGAGCAPAWRAAEACRDAGDSTWCPIFKPDGEGLYSLQTRATDAAGQRETPSQSYTFYVDGTPPNVNAGFSEGALLPGQIDLAFDAWSVRLAGTVSDPPLADGHPGSGAASVSTTLYDASGAVAGLGAQSAPIVGDAWAVNYLFAGLPTGQYTLTLVASDQVGNVSDPVSLVVHVDGSAPEVVLNASSVPTTTLTAAASLSGLALEVPASGNAQEAASFGVQGVEAAFFAAAPALYNEFQQRAGLARFYPLDDQPNLQGELTFMDLASARHGVCASPTGCPTPGVQGHSGSAVEFDGLDDAVLIGDDLALSASFTVAFWARRASAGRSEMIVGQGQALSNQGLSIGFRSDDKFVFGFYDAAVFPASGGLYRNDLATDEAYTDTDWHLWVCAYDANQQMRSIYRDGELAGRDVGVPSYQGSGDVFLGRGVAENAYFRGRLNDVYIYSWALGRDEVQFLYNDLGSRPAWPAVTLAFDTPRAVGGDVFSLEGESANFAWRLQTGADDLLNKSVAGKVGSFALRFDGIDDVVEVAHQAELNFETLTVAGWVKPAAGLADGAPLAAKGSGGSEAWSLDFVGGQPRLFFYQDSVLYSCQADESLPVDAWSHVAATYDGAAIVLYVNGMLVKSCPAAGGVLPENDHALSVGARQSGSGDYDLNFSGAIDDLRLYRRAIAAPEVQELFYTGWQSVALSASGAGVTSAEMTIALPAGLEGSYRLALRSTDMGGNFSAAQGNAWNGSVDTLAPRVFLWRTYPAQNRTNYSLLAQDFNLAPGSLQFDRCTLETTTSTNQNDWYLAMIGASAPQVNGLWASCTVDSVETQPVSAQVCDLPGNCAIAAIGAEQRTSDDLAYRRAAVSFTASGLAIPESRLAEAPLYTAIISPSNRSVFVTDTLPITITGELIAPLYGRDLWVTVDDAPLLETHWPATATLTETTWTAAWTPVTPGPHLVAAYAGDQVGNTILITSTFYVDTDVPTVTLSSTPYTIWYDAEGGVELRGQVHDAGGVASVTIEVAGPVNTPPFYASVHAAIFAAGDEWVASWPLGLDAPINAVPYTFTIRVTDMAGRQTTTLVPDFIVDLILPEVSIPTVKIDGVAVEAGQVITQPAVEASFTFSATDNASVEYLWYAWLTEPVDPELDYPGLITITHPGPDLLNAVTPLSVLPGTAGMARYLYVGVLDVWNGYNSRFWGPIYQDPAGTPDYIGMSETDGPYAGQPYRQWMQNGCTLLGTDRRVLERAQAGGALNQAQNLYTTWDRSSLRLAWTGANWDHAGDLFIYLDTTAGGSYLAYNPYPATQDNTIVLLPAEDQPCQSPPASAFNADYALWVQDSRTATLLRWNDAQAAWETLQDLPLAGDWGYRFSAAEPGYTDIRLPFDLVGVADPSAGEVGLVAFASNEGALRLWSVMPPANPVNSALVTHLGPGIERPSRLLLTDAYRFTLGDGVCQARQGRLQFEFSADPGGLGFSLTDDDIRLALPTTTCDALFDPYDAAYQDWLANEFCPLYYWDVECRADKQPTEGDLLSALSSFMQVEYPAVLPGQAIDYTIRYHNDTPTTYLDVWADLNESLGSVAWPDHCNLIPLGDIPAGGQGSFTFTGVAGQSGAGTTLANLFDGMVGLDLASCTYTSGDLLAELSLKHTEDHAAPSYVAIQGSDLDRSRTVIGPDHVRLQGVVADESPVPLVTIQVQGPDGLATLPCADPTPDDGQWTCEWDVTASNGGVRPADGDTFILLAQAADVFGQTSAWSQPLVLTVDDTPPSLELDAALQGEAPLLSGASPLLSGSLADNRLVDSVQVCDADGQSCRPAEVILDPATISSTLYIYEDIPDAPLSILDATQDDVCRAPVVRTFTVTETFTVASLQVGLAAEHTYRGDLNVTLQSPLGTRVDLMAASDNDRYNLDVLWSDAAWKLIDDDWRDHLLGDHEYQYTRRPLSPLSAFYGEAAQGVWTLTVCDSWPHDDGDYYRSRLVFSADALPANTQAAWQYALPGVQGSDNQAYSALIYGFDSAGNLTVTQQLDYRVDNVAPLITATQLVTRAVIVNQIQVLSGALSDGGEAYVFVTVLDPYGLQSQENVTHTLDGAWTFTLHPTLLGEYNLTVNAIDAAGNLTHGGAYTVRIAPLYQHYLPLILSQNPTGRSTSHPPAQEQPASPPQPTPPRGLHK